MNSLIAYFGGGGGGGGGLYIHIFLHGIALYESYY